MPETASILQDSMKQEAPDASASESMSQLVLLFVFGSGLVSASPYASALV